jgi:hypothetical protein
LHGGASPLGPAHPRFKHGRYSRILPKGLRHHLAAPAPLAADRLSIRDELALVTVRRNEMLSRLHGPVSTALWRRLLKGWLRVEAAPNAARRAAALQVFSERIRRGASDKEQWDELHRVQLQRVRLCVRYTLQTAQRMKMMPRDQLMDYAAALCGVILHHVADDPGALARLTAEFDVLLGSKRLASSDTPEGGARLLAGLVEVIKVSLATAATPAPPVAGADPSGDPGVGKQAATGGAAACGAKKRDGSRCRKRPAVGRTRCRLHGGESPRGANHPRFKNGRYSRYLPKGLRDKYERLSPVAADLSRRDDISLTRFRINQLLSLLKGDDAALLWKELLTRWAACEAAEAGTDRAARQAAGRALLEVIQRGAEEDRVWEQLIDLALLVSEFCASEWRRMRAMGEVLTEAEALTLVLALCGPVQRCVNPKTRVRMAKDIDELNQSISKRYL